MSFVQIFLDFFNNLCKPEKYINYYFYIDELKCLLEQSSGTDCNLTKRYTYASMYKHLRQSFVIKKWEKFKKQSPKMQLSERAACIIAQSFQPEKDVFYSNIKESLDNYTQEVLNLVKEKYPNHSIFSISAENFFNWQNNNISISNWDYAEGIQIVKTIEKYLFDKLKFKKSESTELKFLCIDYVLENKSGQQIIVNIIYQSVARRLGLRCDITDTEGETRRCYDILIWKPKDPESRREVTYLLLDGSMSINPELWINKNVIGCSITTAEDILRKILDVFKDDKYAYAPTLCNNMLMTIPEEWLGYVWKFENVTKLKFCNKNNGQTNTRSKEVQFAVGMIVKHQGKGCSRQHLSSYTGVIIGWHQYIDRHNVKLTSNQEIDQNVLYLKNCSNFDNTKKQTHYIMLTDNNEMCYVGEDSITLTTPKWINNSEVGRYFCKFEGTHYTPNKMLTRLFPQDAAVLQLPNITTAISDN